MRLNDKLRENRMMNKKIRIFLISLAFIVLVSGLFFAQEVLSEDSELNEFLYPEYTEQLVELSGEDKQKKWVGADKDTKNTAVWSISNHLSNRRWEGDMLTNGALVLGEAVFNKITKDLNSLDINIKGIDLNIANDHVGGLGGYLSDLGYNPEGGLGGELVKTKVKDFVGFESGDLSWESETVIGAVDRNIYLDLNKIPPGVEEVRYENGKFYLKKYSGETLVIGGETDLEGNVILKNTRRVNSDGEEKFIKISPFDIATSGSGEVEITNEGFVIRGDAVVDFEGVAVKNLDGNDNGKFNIFTDRFVLEGVELDLKGYATVTPKNNGKFIVPVGDTRGFLDFLNVRLPDTLGFGEISEGVALFKDKGVFGDRYEFKFDKERLTHIRTKVKDGDSEWIAIKDLGGDLKKVYDKINSNLRFDENGRVVQVKTFDEDFKPVFKSLYGVDEKGEPNFEKEIREIYANIREGSLSHEVIDNVRKRLNGVENRKFVKEYVTQIDLTERGFLAKEVSFEDYFTTLTSSGGQNRRSIYQESASGGVKFYEKVKLRFDESGELSHYKEGNNQWIDLRDAGSEDAGFLVNSLIKELQDPNGARVDYAYVKDQFYKNKEFRELTDGARILSIDTHQDNFAAFIGNNVFVGGEGKIDLQRSIPSLTGVDAKKFETVSGDALFVIDGKNLNWNRKSSGAFEIKSIDAVKDGFLYAGFSFVEDPSNPGKIVKTKNNKLVGGKNAYVTPFGVQANVYTVFDTKAEDGGVDIVDAISSARSVETYVADYPKRDRLINAAMRTNFEIHAEAYLPAENVRLSYGGDNENVRANQDKLLKEIILPQLTKKVFPQVVDLEELGKKRLKQKYRDVLTRIVESGVRTVSAVEFENIEFVIRNNRENDPSITVSTISGEQKPIELESRDAEFIRDAIELGLRMPDESRGRTLFLGKDTPYGPNTLIKQLHYDAFGDSVRTLGAGDVASDRFFSFGAWLDGVEGGQGFIQRFARDYMDDVK